MKSHSISKIIKVYPANTGIIRFAFETSHRLKYQDKFYSGTSDEDVLMGATVEYSTFGPSTFYGNMPCTIYSIKKDGVTIYKK